jgi:hypothetical protein
MLEKSHELMCTISRLALALMYTSMPDGNSYMNHLPTILTNANGHELRGLDIKPSAEELISYLQVLDNMPPPKLEKGAPHEHEYVAEDPKVLYGKLNKKYYHIDTGKVPKKVVSGFKLPPIIKD